MREAGPGISRLAPNAQMWPSVVRCEFFVGVWRQAVQENFVFSMWENAILKHIYGILFKVQYRFTET